MPDQVSIGRPLLLGHRGARAVRSIPENSIESFERALADGCDGFEFDVRLTADGVAVVCHDPVYKRIEIARAPAEQLRVLPRLEDVLQRFHERAFLDIELKVEGLERITVELLRKHPPSRGYVVSSFHERVLYAVYKQDKTVPLGYICESREELGEWMEVPCNYVIPHHSLITEPLLAAFRDVRKSVLVWTVNDRKRMIRLRDLGVDGIISDKPALLRETLADQDRG
jgi:glycerophosphoryl diester phosphodiesterase